jgi:hypothetical protein
MELGDTLQEQRSPRILAMPFLGKPDPSFSRLTSG